MKHSAFALISTLLALTAPAFAGLTVNVMDCATTYGPEERKLAVLIDTAENWVNPGYLELGMFFELKVAGCRHVDLVGKFLSCDGVRIGKIGAVQVRDDGPVARFTLNPEMNFEISGSCRPQNRSLHAATALGAKPTGISHA